MNVLAGFRNSFSRSSDAIVAPAVDEPSKASAPTEAPIPEHDHLDSERHPTETEHTPREVTVTQVPVAAEHAAAPGNTATTVSEHTGIEPKSEITSPKPTPRRWSLQHLVRGKRSATTLEKSGQETPGVTIPHKSSAAERRAQHNAQVVRTLIVGPDSTSPSLGKRTRTVSKQEVIKTKAALLEPREANKVIAHLRTLPLPDAPASSAPIHAVCFPFKEAEADEGHFSRMKKGVGVENDSKVDKSEISAASAPPSPPSISSATFESLADTFKNLQLVSLIASPDFGLGQPGNGNGILAGALPTAETIIKGAVQVTPQLMSLGYATGRAIVPNHTGVYPPTDRMSVLTYWWGLELVLPEPTMSYLDQAQSISHTMMNFLSGLALVYGGVREILPFIRYISQFMEWEFGAIKAQDQGQGVVCAATWIMPAAMVPRAWDFPTPPATAPLPAAPEVGAPDSTAPIAPSAPSKPEPASGEPVGAPTIPNGQTPDTAPEQRQPDALPSAQAPPPTISPIALFPGGITTQAVGAASAT